MEQVNGLLLADSYLWLMHHNACLISFPESMLIHLHHPSDKRFIHPYGFISQAVEFQIDGMIRWFRQNLSLKSAVSMSMLYGDLHMTHLMLELLGLVAHGVTGGRGTGACGCVAILGDVC